VEKITYCIHRTEYPWGLSQKILPAAYFVSLKICPAAHIFREMFFFIIWGCISFEVLYSVYQYISNYNDSNSNTEWSQRHNLYQTAFIKVSNNEPFFNSNLLRYKLHNIISIPKQFIRKNMTKHSDYFVWKDTSERVARRCDDTVDMKRVNSCVLKSLFLEGVERWATKEMAPKP